jgi:hypothetical protein
MVRRVGMATLVSVVLCGAIAGTATATDLPLVFDLTMFGCPGGTGPGSTSLKITWRNSDGELKRTRTVTTFSNGLWFMSQSQCTGARIEPGDLLTAESTSPPLNHAFTVPLITGSGNRKTDVVHGVGPANTSLDISVLRTALDTGGFQSYGPFAAATTASGSYSLDLTGFSGSGPNYKALGQDSITAKWTGPNGDKITRQFKIPGVVVDIGATTVTGLSTDFKLSTFSIKDSTGAVRGGGSAIALAFGSFTAELRSPGGAPLRPHAGDTLVGDHTGFTTTILIPTLTVSFDTSTDVISGVCMPSSPYLITALVSNGAAGHRGITDGSGATTPVDIKTLGTFDLQGGDRVQLLCQRPSGDRISRTVAVP